MRNIQRFFAVAILCVVALGGAGCDPGYRLDPVEGARQSDNSWVIENSDLRVQFISPGGTHLSSYLAPESVVENLTQDRVSLLSSQLTTGGQTYRGSFGRRDGQEVPQVDLSPRERKRVPIFFSLGKPLRDALGEQATITVSYTAGDGATQQLAVRLQRRRSG